MRNCFFVVTVLLAAGAGLVACSDDDSSSSPLQPSPLATAPSGGGGGVNPFHLLAGDADLYGGPAAGLTAGANPGLSQLAPHTRGFNAYNARIEYVDGEVTITFVPVDMPGMPDAAREYRNRAVTIRHCPVEPHHVGQRCGEPVFEESFAFVGSPSRTLTLPDCAGWLVIEAAELSADRADGWRNAPLSCRTDEEGRTVTSVDTDGNGAGWEDSRFSPWEPEPELEPEPDLRPVWVLLADSLTAIRGNVGFPGYPFTGAGPDGGGSFLVRWARWYYAEGETGRVIAQVYSEGSWAHGGTSDVGCRVTSRRVPPPSAVWIAKRATGGGQTTMRRNGAELLGSEASVRRLDGAGNPIPRVPSDYTDDPARLWTFSIPRTTHTRFTLRCTNNAGVVGELYYMTVPLPPSS